MRDGGPRAAGGTASGLGAPVGQHRAVGQTPRSQSTTPHPKDGDGLPAGVSHLSRTQQSSEEAALPRQGPCSSRSCGPRTGSRRRPTERGPRANLEMRRGGQLRKAPHTCEAKTPHSRETVHVQNEEKLRRESRCSGTKLRAREDSGQDPPVG